MRITRSNWVLLFLGIITAPRCGHGVREPHRLDQSRLAPVAPTVPHTRGGTLAVELSATSSLSAARLWADVHHLASDALEGRGAATKGIEAAAAYLEHQLREAGLQPAFGDGFRQPFEMTTGARFGKSNALRVAKERPLSRGRDFAPLALSATGHASAELTFAGFGIIAPDLKYDDFAGLDARGRILVVLSGEPGDDDPKSPFDGKRPTHHSSLRSKVLRAREAGAKGVLVVRERVEERKGTVDPEADAGIIALSVSFNGAKRLLGFDLRALKAQIDRTYAPASRATKRMVELDAEVERDRRVVSNIAGVLAPSTLTSTETVVIGAHYDHLGYGGAASLSDKGTPEIHNGADDNASGTATVLEIARDLARQPAGLVRRVMFVLFAGEESGLLGSNHFVKHPPVELGSIAAMVNLDMVGHLRDRKLSVMGVRTGRELTQLARRFVEARHLVGTLGGDGYGPSDHTSFYASGIPVLFLFTGAHEHYHRPSDDADTLNYPGMADVGAVAGDLVRALASAQQRVAYTSAPPPTVMRGGGYGPYFGSIPDFAESKEGVLLSGVRPNSPAEKAGVRKGDALVRFNGVEVKSLEDFTVALRDTAPGDIVEVEVLRDGTRLKLTAKLERRE